MEDLFMSSSQGARPISDAALGILGACSEVMAKWFSVMRGAVMRERSRQEKFREDNGLKKNARIPYAVPPLTDSDLAIVSLSESVIRAMFCDSVADYASQKFHDAIRTGDMRAFKIRLVIIKARDSINNLRLREDFSAGIEKCIDDAETKAGCIQEHSPRRLSKKEQERKKRLDKSREARRAKQEAQMELPLIWTNTTRNDITHNVSCNDMDTASQKVVSEACNGLDSPNVLNSRYCTDPIFGHGQEFQTPLNAGVEESCAGFDCVTVTGKERYSNAEQRYCNGLPNGSSNGYRNGHGIIRKTGTYNSVEDILNDIDEGSIVPYEYQDEIIEDMDEGFLTPEEAIMFVAAMDHYSPEDVDMPDDGDLGDDGDEKDGEDDDDMLMDEEDKENRDDRDTGFSYNPNGFGGCEDGDDEW